MNKYMYIYNMYVYICIRIEIERVLIRLLCAQKNKFLHKIIFAHLTGF